MTEIEFSLTLEDKLRFSEYHAEHSPSIRRSRSMYTAFAVLVLAVVGAWIYTDLHEAWVVVFFGILAFGCLWFCPWNWNRTMREKTRRLYTEGTHPPLPEHYKMRLETDGLHVSTDKAESVIRWSAIERIVTSDSDFYLYTSAVNAIPIPRRAFDSALEFDQFTDQVRAMREQAAGLAFLD